MSSNDWLGTYSGDYDQPKNGERLIQSLSQINDTLHLILTELKSQRVSYKLKVADEGVDIPPLY